MNPNIILSGIKGFMSNRAVLTGATAGGIAGARKGNVLFKETGPMLMSLKKKQMSFNVRVPDSLLKGSFADPAVITATIQQKYPAGRYVAEDFKLIYNPGTKSVTFEPTDKFLTDYLANSNLLSDTRTRIMTILSAAGGFAAIGAATGFVGSKMGDALKRHSANSAEEFEKEIKAKSPLDQDKIAYAIFNELGDRFVSHELNKIASVEDFEYFVKNNYARK